MYKRHLILLSLFFIPGCRPSAVIVQQPIRLQNAEFLHPSFNPNEASANVANATSQVEKSPASAIGWGMLASASLQLGRETGDAKYFASAESAARKSLVLRKSNNGAAYSALVGSLFAQHRFGEAKAIWCIS